MAKVANLTVIFLLLFVSVYSMPRLKRPEHIPSASREPSMAQMPLWLVDLVDKRN